MTDTAAAGPMLVTQRLILRRFRDADREPFARLNADPDVMRHFPAALSRPESDALVDRIDSSFREYGYGLWAVERVDDGRFLGFAGLARPTFEAAFMPCVEIGWRFAADAWGHGYATESASAAMDHGFETVGLDEILSWTSPLNTASRGVMERLGMHRDPAEDFDHPRLPEGHALRPHVLYRLRRDEWRERGRR